MTQKEDCLKDMLAGKPWEYIVDKYNKSVVYSALTEFFKIKNPEYEKAASMLKKIREEVKQREQENMDLEEKNESLSTHILEKAKKANQVEDTVKKLYENLAEKKSELNSYEQKISELEKDGLSIELLKKVGEIDTNTSDQLLNRVKTSQRFEKTQTDLKKAEKLLYNTRNEIKNSSNHLASLKSEVKSEHNKLQKIKSENIVYSEAVEILVDSLRIYPVELLTGIIRAFRLYEIRDQPGASVEHFLNLIGQAKKVSELDSSIVRKTNELNAINHKLNKLKGILTGLEDGALASILNVRDNAVKNIVETSNLSMDQVKSVSNTSISGINQLSKNVLNQIQEIQQEGETNIKQVVENQKYSFNLVFWNANSALQLLETEINKFGELNNRAGKMEAEINAATLLFGIIKNPQQILELDPRLVAQLAERIHLYVQYKYPNRKSKAPDKISKNEMGINSYWDANLKSISAWLCYALWNLVENMT